jgi:hypothetical protein
MARLKSVALRIVVNSLTGSGIIQALAAGADGSEDSLWD